MIRRLHQRDRGSGRRHAAGIAVVAALGLAAAACSSSPAATGTSDGHVTISVDCAPPASAPQQHKEWLEDVALFEKQNPNITVNSIFENPCEVPASFTAMLKAGNEPNVFYTYFTDKNQVLDAGQAADITSYVNSTTVPALKDIVPTALAAVTAGKTLYGLPTVNYTQGLIINRMLFKQAGLNPDQPPTTWAEVGAGRQGDHQARPRHLRLRRLQRGQQRRLALLLGDRRRGRPDDQLGRHRGSLQLRPGQGRAAGAAPDALRRPQHEPDAAARLGHAAEADGREQARHVHRRPRRHLQRDRPAGRRQHQRLRNGPAAQHLRHPGGLTVRRQRLHVRQARHPRADRGRHQVAGVREPDAGRGLLQLRQAEGRRLPGGLPRATDVHRRHRG